VLVLNLGKGFGLLEFGIGQASLNIELRLKKIRVRNDPNKTLSLVRGLAVYSPTLAIDDLDDTLVYLELVGAKQSVKANWAA
jgi:hypothetical protein